ncbi:hypothetical protein GCM10012275_53100 [Longimycelium tulufanense]|uniref:Uncharacterized protein n=1 Tax=Longimycelium tulufanense TaxID=907463 RepID=A0A8J3CGW5_9PSEU|nr:hypothetical protein [Longimycelium tulufanense]GGM75768.1 hypothetical protein GCM10012275_53100 [Longimycelium tulufanense]
MSVRTAADRMTSDRTRHIAHRTGARTWRLSWLPDREVPAGHAITGLLLAEKVARDKLTPQGRHSALIMDWAADLGLTAEEAITRIWTMPHVIQAAPEQAGGAG